MSTRVSPWSRRIHVAPYLPCLAEGVGTIMPSYSSWNGLKCSASKELLTDLLKDELGFLLSIGNEEALDFLVSDD